MTPPLDVSVPSPSSPASAQQLGLEMQSTGEGGAKRKVFCGKDGSLLANSLAFGSSCRGGAFVASLDVDGDGISHLIDGEIAGGCPVLKVLFTIPYLAFHPSFRGGLFVGR